MHFDDGFDGFDGKLGDGFVIEFFERQVPTCARGLLCKLGISPERKVPTCAITQQDKFILITQSQSANRDHVPLFQSVQSLAAPESHQKGL
jgi:hypothetical protein